MSVETCSPEQLTHRQTATFHFVPFVARLFTEGPLRADTPSLSSDPQDHTAESILRLREIFKRAAWRFLARQLGWRNLPASTSSAPVTALRLWQTNVASLRFTSDALVLCLRLYNATRSKQSIEELVVPSCDQANGDLILHHLAYLRLQGNPMLAGIPHNYKWTGWELNPLNVIAQPLLAATAIPADRWTLLTTQQMAPFLPWILSSASILLTTQERTTQRQGFTDWMAWQSAQRRCIDGLITALQEANQPTLFIPLMEWFVRQAKKLPKALKAFDSHTEKLRLNQRQSASSDWHHTLGYAEMLQSMAEDFTGLHPADREPCHRLYLASAQSTGFTDALPIIRAARQTLRPVLT